jgi:hypothetical protein
MPEMEVARGLHGIYPRATDTYASYYYARDPNLLSIAGADGEPSSLAPGKRKSSLPSYSGGSVPGDPATRDVTGLQARSARSALCGKQPGVSHQVSPRLGANLLVMGNYPTFHPGMTVVPARARSSELG